MKILKAKPGQKLFLGHQGESLALTVIFNIEPWIELYGLGTAHLLHQRNGDAEPYPVATVQDGTEVSWAVTDADTAMDGEGKYELRYYVGETLAKSDKGETYTYKALQYGAQPPEPIQGWLDHVAGKEHELLEAVGEAKAASEQAAGSAGDALSFANAAEESAQNAGIAVKNASDLATNADLSAKEAAGQSKAAADSAAEAKKAEEAAKKAAEETGGVNVTAKPGQLIRVKSVDENGKPTAWGPVPWGWVEGGMVEILPECQPLFEADEGIFSVTEGVTALVAGETYIVNWNGTEYTCIGQDASAMMPGAFLLGEGSEFGLSGAGEPFVLAIVEEDGTYALVASPLDGTTELTLSIYHNAETIHPIPGKLLPEGVPYVEQGGMVKITVPFTGIDEDGDGISEMLYSTEPIGLVLGETYVIKWKGVDYSCVAQDASAMYLGAILVGNDAPITQVDNGIPFVLIEVTAETAAKKDGVRVLVSGTDDLVDESFTIYGERETIHKLDNRCLDLEWLPTSEWVKGSQLAPEQTPNAANYLTDFNFSLIDTSITMLLITVDGVEYLCPANVEETTSYGGGVTVATLSSEGGFQLYTDYFPNQTAESFAMVKFYDGGSHTMSVYIAERKANRLPKEFLPDDVSGIVIRSSTADSSKKFKLTVDDSGTITATEVTQ